MVAQPLDVQPRHVSSRGRGSCSCVLPLVWPVLAGPAAGAATVASATPQLPGKTEWWSGEGAQTRAALIRGDVSLAEDAVGELLAEPAPDEWDPNWPPQKAAWAALRGGAVEGDEYILGNGMGYRGSFRVVAQGDHLRAVLLDSWWALAPLAEESQTVAEALLAQG